MVHDYSRGLGHSRYVAELAGRFKHEHEVHIFANTFAEPEPGLAFHHVPAWRGNALASILTFILPATWAIGKGYDIIHAQGVCGLRQNVVTAHICQGAWHEAMVQHTGRPNWRKRVFNAITDRLERWVFCPSRTQHVIAVSDRIRTDLREHYGRTENVHVIPHGVDTELFHPNNRSLWRGEIRRQFGMPADTCVALYVGDAQKALSPAIRALALVPGMHLLSVSRSPAQPYRELSQREGVAERVHLAPATKYIERFYAAADLFIFPTFYDSFGLVVTEAMASGLPVICGAAAGAAQLIEDGVHGLLVDDAWNPVALAGPLTRLRDDAPLRARLGEAARRRAEEYTWDRVADETMTVYRELLGGTP